MTPPKRRKTGNPTGRPALPPGEALVVVTFRASPEQKEKFRRLKLVGRVRRLIDRAKE